jgi:hypothetical protein
MNGKERIEKRIEKNRAAIYKDLRRVHERTFFAG